MKTLILAAACLLAVGCAELPDEPSGICVRELDGSKFDGYVVESSWIVDLGDRRLELDFSNKDQWTCTGIGKDYTSKDNPMKGSRAATETSKTTGTSSVR